MYEFMEGKVILSVFYFQHEEIKNNKWYFYVGNRRLFLSQVENHLYRSFNLIVSSRQELRSFMSKVHNESRNKCWLIHSLVWNCK